MPYTLKLTLITVSKLLTYVSTEIKICSIYNHKILNTLIIEIMVKFV